MEKDIKEKVNPEENTSLNLNDNLDPGIKSEDNASNIKRSEDNKIITENHQDLGSKETKKEINSKKETKENPKKEIPIEKKPFDEFINSYLIPSLSEELNKRGLEINEINLRNTYRPIAGDKCWIIYCEIKDTCNFWLSFESDDISSPKSISLSKINQNPSILESFLIDEKRITLKLIISRILQRLNGQKLIGVN